MTKVRNDERMAEKKVTFSEASAPTLLRSPPRAIQSSSHIGDDGCIVFARRLLLAMDTK